MPRLASDSEMSFLSAGINECAPVCPSVPQWLGFLGQGLRLAGFMKTLLSRTDLLSLGMKVGLEGG